MEKFEKFSYKMMLHDITEGLLCDAAMTVKLQRDTESECTKSQNNAATPLLSESSKFPMKVQCQPPCGILKPAHLISRYDMIPNLNTLSLYNIFHLFD